jgi:hypothetical protein
MPGVIFFMRSIKPDYSKIIFVGIPIGFIAWFVLIFPSAILARTLGNTEYWLYISLLLTAIFVFGYLVFCIKYPSKIGAAIVDDPNVLRSIEGDFQCRFCGKIISNEQSVKIWQKSISGENIICCSNCFNKKTQGSYKATLLLSIIQLLLGIVLIFYSPEERTGWFLLNLFLMALFSVFMIIPHELGHVLAAKSIGTYVVGVVIGLGKTVLLKRYWNVSWEFKSLPAGGITIPLILNVDKYRSKLFFIVLGGPLINLFTIFILLVFYPGTVLYSGLFKPQLSFVSAFFWANIIDLLYNLLPIQVNTNLGKIGSDGLNMIKLPFMSQEAVEHCVIKNRTLYSHINSGKYNKANSADAKISAAD